MFRSTRSALINFLGCAVPILGAIPTLAQPHQVALVVDWPGDSPAGSSRTAVKITVSPVIHQVTQAPPDTVVLEVETPKTLHVELRRDITWELKAEGEGLWAPTKLIVGGEGVEEVHVRLVPTATVTARIEKVSSGEDPEVLAVRLRSPGKIPDVSSLFDETLECPVKNGRWHCEVPSGVFDIRVRSPGFISHFFWERELPPGATIDLGGLELRSGASISGWLTTDDRSPLQEGIRVSAAPRITRAGTPREEEKLRSLTVTAPVGERGFFHLVGLQPGAYILRAGQEGYVPLRSLPVIVIEGTESELREALTLTRPADLRIYVDPIVDAQGGSWELRLLAHDMSEPRASGASDSLGTWTATSLAPGRYTLMISDSQGSRVASEDISVEAPATDHWIALEYVEVEGVVTLGDEPLVAELAFGGSAGRVSIKMNSDPEGRFSGSVPRPGSWSVDVRSRSKNVFRRLRSLEIDPVPGSSRARVEIELPGTRLEGDVVDPEGQGIPDATVLAIPVPSKPGDPAERPSYARTEQGGVFAFEGFAPARYRLQAILPQGPDQRHQSEPIELELREDDPFASVRLVIGPSLQLQGRVLSRHGGVPGASVIVKPLGTRGGILVPSTSSGPDGSFGLSLPVGTRQVQLTVMAPGFLLYREVHPILQDEVLSIYVRQLGAGTLVIRPNSPIDLKAPRGVPHVVRYDGVEFDLGTLGDWASLHHAPPLGSIAEIPQLPPGGYSVCWPPSPEDIESSRERQCSDGYLPAYGRLEIAQPSDEGSAEAQTTEQLN